MDYTGLHHFGILVDDLDDAATKVAAHGGEHYMDQSEPERVGGFEVKMYGPEGVLFDIAEHPWTGSEALPTAAKVKEAAE
jgi:predicted enzyme related to lactoylglutathione lyase